jgi:DNA-binding IclR family transcriptional regulator
VGGSLPLWSSVGRVFLAFLPRDVTEPVFLAQRGGGVPEDVGYDTLADELAAIRERHVCVVSNTPVLGIEGFASPVFDAFGNVPLVIGVVTPHASIGDDDRLQIIDLLLAASSTISAELGYRAPDRPG